MGIAEQLLKTKLFEQTDLDDLEALIEQMHIQAFEQGEILFRAGDVGDTMYIIRAGRIRIYMNDKSGDEITITHYGENEIFGELSPIDQRPRSASASAAEPLVVLALSRDQFLQFLGDRPGVGMAMVRNLSQRLRNTTTYLEEFNKPKPKPVPKGEELRRGASGTAAELLDQVQIKREQEQEPPNALDETLPRTNPYESLLNADTIKIERDPTTLEMRSKAGGIFDRVAQATKEKADQENKEENKEENKKENTD